VNVNDGHTTTTTPGATLNWYQPSEAKRDKAGGKHTVSTVKVMTHFQTVRFSVGIVINEPSTSNDAINTSLIISMCVFFDCLPLVLVKEYSIEVLRLNRLMSSVIQYEDMPKDQ
jgi:hypothetical protein